MTVILPSFDAAGEKSFNRADTVEIVEEPRWHDWFITGAVVALTLGGFWILWGQEMAGWLETLR